MSLPVRTSRDVEMTRAKREAGAAITEIVTRYDMDDPEVETFMADVSMDLLGSLRKWLAERSRR